MEESPLRFIPSHHRDQGKITWPPPSSILWDHLHSLAPAPLLSRTGGALCRKQEVTRSKSTSLLIAPRDAEALDEHLSQWIRDIPRVCRSMLLVAMCWTLLGSLCCIQNGWRPRPGTTCRLEKIPGMERAPEAPPDLSHQTSHA